MEHVDDPAEKLAATEDGGDEEAGSGRKTQLVELRERLRKASWEGGISLPQLRRTLKTGNQFFLERLFRRIDRSRRGAIAGDDYVDFLLSSAGTVDGKIDLLFETYDVGGKGYLVKSDLNVMLGAMLRESIPEIAPADVRSLSTHFMVECGSPEAAAGVTLGEFKSVVGVKTGFGQDIAALVDHWTGTAEDKSDRGVQVVTGGKEEDRALRGVESRVKTDPNFYGFLFVYVAAVVLMMGLAAFTHRGAKDKDGAVNYLLIAARVTGFPLNLLLTMCFVFMLWPCLNSLREHGLNRYLPLNDNRYFHVATAWAVLLFGAIHAVAHLLNVNINIQPDPENYLAQNGKKPGQTTFQVKPEGGVYSYEDWIFSVYPGLFGLIPGWANLTGCVIAAVILLVFLTSQSVVRRRGYFNVFFYCHLMYWPLLVLLILHAPNFSYFFPLAGIFLVLHVLQRIFYGKTDTYVSTALLLPPDSLCLVVRKPSNWSYSTGDWVEINVPRIAQHEWHAFTVSSTPDLPDVFTLHVRAIGPWTKALRSIVLADYTLRVKKEEQQPSETVSCGVPHKISRLVQAVHYNSPNKINENEVNMNDPIVLYINGPFHAPANNIFRSEHAVLVCTGVDVTPIASLLQTVMYRYKSATQKCPQCLTSFVEEDASGLGALRKVEFFWIVSDPMEASWFLDILAAIEIEQHRVQSTWKLLDIHIYVTRATAKTDLCAVALRIAVNLMHTKQDRALLTDLLQSRTEAGRPNLSEIFRRVHDSGRCEVGVFFNGSPAVGSIVQQKCFKFHFNYYREAF